MNAPTCFAQGGACVGFPCATCGFGQTETEKFCMAIAHWSHAEKERDAAKAECEVMRMARDAMERRLDESRIECERWKAIATNECIDREAESDEAATTIERLRAGLRETLPWLNGMHEILAGIADPVPQPEDMANADEVFDLVARLDSLLTEQVDDGE